MAKKVALVAALAGFALLVAGSAQAWRWYRLPARVQAALPPVPVDLDRRPAVLARRIEAARALTRSRRQVFEGVADLGRLYHENGYLKNAEACWRLLMSEQRREPRWPYYLADLRRTAGDDAQVLALLERTVRLDPAYPTAWLQLAELEFKTGRTDAAESDYHRRLALVPADPYANLGLARIALLRGRKDEARRLIEQIVQDAPDFATAHNLYAQMLVDDGNAAGAERQRRLASEAGRFRDAEDPWLWELHAWCFDPKRLCVLGTVQFQARRGDRGRAFTERAVELAPDNPGMYEQLGDLYLKLGETAKARDTLEACLRRATAAPPSVMVYVDLADAYRILHQPVDAMRVTEEGLKRTPGAFELHNERGAILADLGRHEEAITAYREAIAIAPNDTDSNYSLGVSLLALGRRDEAEASFKRSLAMKPTFPKALLMLARLEMDAGRFDAAGQYLQPLIESHSDQPQVRAVIVLWHLRAGEAAERAGAAAAAERHYRHGLAVEPDNASLQASLGVLCLLQNRMEDALPALEAFHRLRPEEAQSALFLGQVYARLGRIDDARKVLTEGRQLAERSGSSTTARHCQEILDQL